MGQTNKHSVQELQTMLIERDEHIAAVMEQMQALCTQLTEMMADRVNIALMLKYESNRHKVLHDPQSAVRNLGSEPEEVWA